MSKVKSAYREIENIVGSEFISDKDVCYTRIVGHDNKYYVEDSNNVYYVQHSSFNYNGCLIHHQYFKDDIDYRDLNFSHHDLLTHGVKFIKSLPKENTLNFIKNLFKYESKN